MSTTSKYVIPAEIGDPVSALFSDDEFVAIGTLMGRIWIYNIRRNTRKMIAGFSDEAIRGIYVQDGTVYATVGDQYCRQIRISDPFDQLESRFDRRSSASGFKYVLQRFNQVTIVYPGMTTFVDVTTPGNQSMCPFKIQQATILNVCPLDVYQYMVLVTEFPATDESTPPPRKFRLVDVAAGETRWELVEPKIVAIRLISKDELVYFAKARLVVYNFVTKTSLAEIRHSSEVLAIDCSLCMGEEGKPWFTVLSVDGSVTVYNYVEGKAVYVGKMKSPCFSLGFPYLVHSCWSDSALTCAVSDDYGAHYLVLRPCGNERLSPQLYIV